MHTKLLLTASIALALCLAPYIEQSPDRRSL